MFDDIVINIINRKASDELWLAGLIVAIIKAVGVQKLEEAVRTAKHYPQSTT